MKRFFKNCRRVPVQKLMCALQMISPDLNPIRYARRAQKQKIPEHLVVVSPGLKPFVSEKCLKHFPVDHIFKYRNIRPRLMFS